MQTVCNVRSPDIGLVELGSTATRAVMSIAVHVVASLYVCRSVLPAFAARRAVVAMPCLTLGSVPGQERAQETQEGGALCAVAVAVVGIHAL